ncbi:hypothetical protein XENOCAPTIV_028577 [Xenoophorus captivus]|uniref:Uncharacterized protein n=1 Tax=Xenoophorus captivus TaxID=1517983 RepID=A0ABV0SI40_9TELE
MDTLMFEHGVHYGQSVTSTEVHKQNTTWIQIKVPFLPIMPLQVSLSFPMWPLKSPSRIMESPGGALSSTPDRDTTNEKSVQLKLAPVFRMKSSYSNLGSVSNCK